ncbi:MAG: YggS family pyridoxal phosphate-dependent enzyme [Chloroflexi bacterium]|nr:YggS family pyridoxal phosphate-dependent enzyme [Chloroflexota bacterium]
MNQNSQYLVEMQEQLPRIRANLQDIQQTIADACARTGRQQGSVQLVAVTKQRSIAETLAVCQCGVRYLGENRVEELSRKVPLMHELWRGPEITWHMIGHLQSRKADDALSYSHICHSVDSFKLAARLERLAQARGCVYPVLLECNVSGEASKDGFVLAERDSWAEFVANAAHLVQYRHTQVRGLMTMAPVTQDPEDARGTFSKLRELQMYLAQALPELDWRELSMGMSGDYRVAIEEGATLVRIGSAIFE